jgi:hypothetical protein
MGFIPSRTRHAPRVERPRLVLAVGQRAFVQSPPNVSYGVLLTDDHGNPGAVALRDGTEVEVLAWRPRGSTGTRYRVCDRSDGADGWLAAEELRATAVRTTPEPPPAAPPPSDGFGRRFGSNS